MSISVVGFDIGTSSSFIAVAKGGGIETIDNEYSDRCTPTYVSFGECNRQMGAAAKQQAISNIKNSLFCFSRLIGKLYNDPMVQQEIKQLPYKVLPVGNGKIGIEVTYMHDKCVFSPEEIMAVQLTKLKEIAEMHLSSPCIDVVINVPNYYTDAERRAMLDSSRIAGLNCVRLVNDTTAVGIAYGLYNRDLPEVEKPSRNVAFVLMGYSNLQVAICAFNQGKMKVLASAADPNLGGRNFDSAIYHHLCKDIENRYKLNVLESPKATLRLLQECEKLKKLMSANSTRIPLNIECFMNDIDISCHMHRAEFEGLIEADLNRVKKTLQHCLDLAKLTAKDITYVELVGGCSRLPAIKLLISQFFGQEGRTTLNADEAVARGCALQAAICSPAFKVREFNITDVYPYSVMLAWDKDDSSTNNEPKITGDNSAEVFPALYNIPSNRQIELQPKADFFVYAYYSEPHLLPNKNENIGEFFIKGIKLQEGLEKAKVRIKLRMNSHGIFTISHAQQAELHDKQVEVEDDNNTMDVDTQKQPEPTAEVNEKLNDNASNEQEKTDKNKKAAPVKPKKMVTKRVVRYRDLVVEGHTLQLNEKQLLESTERECQMVQQDKLERDRSNAKNALEEYIYEMRNSLAGPLEPYVLEPDREAFGIELTKQEDWLYDEGENLPKQPYVDKLNGLKQIGDRYVIRMREHQMRHLTLEHFAKLLTHVEKTLQSISNGEEMYNHLSEEDVNTLSTNLIEKRNWYNNTCNKQLSRPLTEDPIIYVVEMQEQIQAFESICNPILSKPKPVVKPPPTQQPNENGEDKSVDGENNNDNTNTNADNETVGNEKQSKNVKSAGEAECMELD